MAGMLNGLNIELEGHHHLGLDDVKNICKVLVKLIQDGAIVDITGQKDESGRVRFTFEDRI
jgi:inhibitor of KinA sporulation pathway (predicted exonuclease)